jgi:hypothetical protein
VLADQLVDWVAAREVTGGVALWLFRLALRAALMGGGVVGLQAKGGDDLGRKASEGRLRAQTLRHVAWSLVLDDDPGATDPVDRAAAIIVAALALRGDDPHAGILFGTTLVPGTTQFTVATSRSRHVLFGRGRSLWAVPVMGEDGRAYEAKTVASILRRCIPDGSPSPGVLSLTSAPRSVAAPLWSAIMRTSPEAAALVSEALFSVFMDSESPSDVDTTGRLAQGGPARERCFWHALQVVVFANAKAAVVGSFVAGAALDAAIAIGGGVAQSSSGTRTGASGPTEKPERVAFPIDPSALDRVTKDIPAPVDAGGYLRVLGLGRKAWATTEGAGAGQSAEAAMVLTLRLALDAVFPDLDELETMVSLTHVGAGIVSRLGTSTPEMRALLAAARSETDDRALAPLVRAAAQAHRAHVKAAKLRASGEAAFEFASQAFLSLSGIPRLLVMMTARLLTVLIVLRTPPADRKRLMTPRIAIDSSAPARKGIAGVGRFGVLAPSTSLWMHHSLSDDDVAFVLQLGAGTVAQAGALRAAIPEALARVHRAWTTPLASGTASPKRVIPPTPLAYRRLFGLLAAVTRR